jgi:hypothetical protein
MKAFNILKILVLDWVITLVMYLSGLAVSSLKSMKKVGDSTYFPSITNTGITNPPPFDYLPYLFISLSFVVLISYLINKSYLKVDKKSYILGQVMYLLSFALLIFGLAFFI